MEITTEQVQSIAPDPASVKAATKVFNKTNWVVEKSARAVWSAIQGSGKKPYYVCVDATNIAFKCTCPSRKFPCKHGLALGFFIAANDYNSIPEKEEPTWVLEWIDKRAAKQQKAVEKTKTVAPKVNKKKKEDKWKKAVKSIEQVELWLQDVIKLGILEFQGKGAAYWDSLSQRMVDAKMPGINTYFNHLAQIDYQRQWEQPVLNTLRSLHLLVHAIKNNEHLDPEIKQEIELLLGWNINKKELLANNQTEVVDDVWFVVKIDQRSLDNLESRKVYLYGVQTNRWAYILEFAFGSSYFADVYIEGGMMQAKLAMYPGISNTRAVVKLKGSQTDGSIALQPILDLALANLAYKKQLAEFPWTFELPQLVGQVNLLVQDNQFFILDQQNHLIAVSQMDWDQYLAVLSQTQGHFFDAFLIRNEDGMRLIGFFINDQLISA